MRSVQKAIQRVDLRLATKEEMSIGEIEWPEAGKRLFLGEPRPCVLAHAVALTNDPNASGPG